jgi:hypothetical protein
MSKATGSKVDSETQAGPPTVESGKEVAVVGETKSFIDKPERTRVHRGQKCPILKTTKDTRTGAIYDLIEITRSVTNRRTGDVSKQTVGKKLRRPGTGVMGEPREIEIEV